MKETCVKQRSKDRKTGKLPKWPSSQHSDYPHAQVKSTTETLKTNHHHQPNRGQVKRPQAAAFHLVERIAPYSIINSTWRQKWRSLLSLSKEAAPQFCTTIRKVFRPIYGILFGNFKSVFVFWRLQELRVKLHMKGLLIYCGASPLIDF